MQYQYHTIIISLIKLKKRVGIKDSHPLFIISSYLAFAQSIYITETYPCFGSDQQQYDESATLLQFSLHTYRQ